MILDIHPDFPHFSRLKSPLKKKKLKHVSKESNCFVWKVTDTFILPLIEKRKKKGKEMRKRCENREIIPFQPLFTPFTSSSHLNAFSVIKANICIALSLKSVIRISNLVLPRNWAVQPSSLNFDNAKFANYFSTRFPRGVKFPPRCQTMLRYFTFHFVILSDFHLLKFEVSFSSALHNSATTQVWLKFSAPYHMLSASLCELVWITRVREKWFFSLSPSFPLFN